MKSWCVFTDLGVVGGVGGGILALPSETCEL